MNKVLSFSLKRIIFPNIRSLCCVHYQVKKYHNNNHEASINTFCRQNAFSLSLIKRFKHKKKGSVKRSSKDEDLESDEEDEEDEDEEDELESQSMSKIMRVKVSSLRIDMIVKNGFGMSRKTVEEAFYESKIRVNYRIPQKLATEVNIDDEIDLILGRSSENPALLNISRLTILAVEPTNNGFKCKISRDVNMLTENYPKPWK